ncbi:uncharacterized protein LOC115633730 [Scaptodrosophila lebanonensis]|uniref:Uncharacterized protein LOC115633730 n=1 Tax=Drosophila lebanonensis TaxID=7225 RepID=A0A6J2UFZ5_DROLE|nr:uncharacterized protein LOC115633730 [Scaptodrosophila lebanonensis]
MDFDNAKENIQPLATGRNASLLQASLCQDASQELLVQRKQLEDNIRQYNGDDPLEPWYAYICWIEQSYPAGGSGSGLLKVMHKCLTGFEKNERYKQDRRFIRLFIKFMEKQEDQIECYQQMYNNGIGTMVADFYIAWAYSYDLSGNFRKADEIFRLGISCRAEPLEDLKEAHQHFGFTVGQRLLYTAGDEAEAVAQELNERRLALQSLQGQRRKNTVTVGSIRTGAAVKSHMPGVVQNDGPSTSRVRNVGRQVEVFNDENADVNNAPTAAGNEDQAAAEEKFTLRSIIDAARHQENLKEPGPWNKAHGKGHKHGELFSSGAHNDLAFKIHVDENALPPITNYERNFDKPFKYPPNFVAKNRPQAPWITPVTIEDGSTNKELPRYNICALYPRPNMELSLEEYRAYCFLKRRDPQAPFVVRNDQWWGTGAKYGLRRYPNFATASKPQTLDSSDKYWKPDIVKGVQTPLSKLYNDDVQQEYQLEEILAAKWRDRRNLTVCGPMDMEETICLPVEQMPRRKSFFPTIGPQSARKSLAVIGRMPRVSMVREEEGAESAAEASQPSAAIAAIGTKPKTNNFDESAEKPKTVGISTRNEESAPQAEAVSSPLDNFVVPALPAAFTKKEINQDDFTPKTETAKPETLRNSTKNEESAPKAKSISPPVDNFVMPALPPSSTKIEIYEDDCTPPAASSKPVSTAFFDSDETCSTQMFNVFLKTHAVSTPKMAQKQAPPRQFGTVLKELTPPPPPEPLTADDVSPVVGGEALSPLLRKQLSTILETSEHAAQSSGATTKSSNASTSSASNTAATLTNKSEVTRTACTPGPMRLQRGASSDVSVLENEAVAVPVGNFTRLEAWEANVPSTPLMKSLRFQEDKTETVPKPFVRFQEDKTETLPKLPSTEVIANASKLMLQTSALTPPVPIDNDDDLCDFFCKSPPKAKPFTSPLAPVNAKRICDQRTPDFHGSSFKSSQDRVKNSFAMFEDEMCALSAPKSSGVSDKANTKSVADAPSVCLDKLGNSFMSDLSFVPETQPPAALPTVGSQPTTLEKQFEIFLDETIPETAAKGSSKKTCTLPEAQQSLNEAPHRTPPRIPSVQDKENYMIKKSFPAMEKQDTHLTATFLKDCSELGIFPPVETHINSSNSQKTAKNVAGNSSLKFLNDSLLKFEQSPNPPVVANTSPNDFFELNAATEMFATNISMIKNSTLLSSESGKRSESPNLESLSISDKSKNEVCVPSVPQLSVCNDKTGAGAVVPSSRGEQLAKSLMADLSFVPETQVAAELPGKVTSVAKHQKQIEIFLDETMPEMPPPPPAKCPSFELSCTLPETQEPVVAASSALPRIAIIQDMANSFQKQQPVVENELGIASSSANSRLASPKMAPTQPTIGCADAENDMSIYYRTTPLSPKPSHHSWHESNFDTQTNQKFVHPKINVDLSELNCTLASDNVNPFNVDLINSLLDSIEFSMYIETLPTCQLVGHVKRLHPQSPVSVHNLMFDVVKMIGKGAYGSVFSGKDAQTGRKVALKQERPPNYWEYYVCLEVHSRLTSEKMMHAYMHIDYALVGNNSSIFISDLSDYGSLITVCNKIKKHTGKNVDEYVVMHLSCQLLDIIDHLHAMGIIHADIKADNFLLMKPLAIEPNEISLQLIDFGVAIDTKLFPPNQTFTYVHNEDAFKCIEMRTDRPWTYQLDLFGLVGVMHVLLFGRYMEVVQRPPMNVWMPKTQLPRYLNRQVWDSVFRTLLNVRDCRSMPDLQELRTQLKSALAEKDKFVAEAISKFNKILKM